MIVNNAAAAAYAADNLARLDAGAGPSVIKFYTATQPAGPDTAITSQELLASHTCSDPTGTLSGRTINFSAIGDDVNVDADGTPTWARHETSAGVAINDYTVTVTGGGGEIQVNNVDWKVGGLARITAMSVAF